MNDEPVAYLLGAYWHDNNPRDQTTRFIQSGIWENGYQSEYLDLVKSIAVGSHVFIKSLFYHNGLKTSVLRIKAKGVVTANQDDGQHLAVDWDKDFKEKDLTEKAVPGIGRYWDTVERVTEPTHLAALLRGEEITAEEPLVNFPLNQILYGPPGTGKTFTTQALTLAILTGKSLADIQGHYGPNQRALQQALAAYQGQTEFVTFHQAFGYEDFIEGIKPYEKENDQLGYRMEDGVFKRMCRQARQAWQAATAGQPAPVALQLATASFDEVYEGFVEELRSRRQAGSHPQFTTRQEMPVEVTAIDEDGTLTLIHLNSAQYKHRVAPKWIRQIYETYASVAEIKKVYEELRQLGGPNVSLQWAIFNALKIYEQQTIAQHATEDKSQLPAPQQATDIPRFVLVVDEINRGNVATIFGELITLLETDKRAGEDNEISVVLPYSKLPFSIPPNLYLLGTMNTADRSVEALDTALRRRFSFTEMRPDAQVIRAQVGDNGVITEGSATIDVARILEALNSRLEQLLDRDHCLGHALLLRVGNLAALRTAFQRSIVPLLQEYFFGDWGKIGLVLGEAFIHASQPSEPGRYALAKFRGYDAAGLREHPVYRLADVATLPAEAFQQIYAPA